MRRGRTVLVIGGGGREHALAWAIARSPEVARVYVAPGNGGTHWPAQRGRAACTSLPLGGTEQLVAFARQEAIDMTVVGPEAPLAAGIVDAFAAAGLPVFGPHRAAARLEASKAFAKAFMQRHHIPTAPARTFDSFDAALDYARSLATPPVIKADGLAAGKGVYLPTSAHEVRDALDHILVKRRFGAAGDQVVVEQRLVGEELSVLAWCDGICVRQIVAARDYKRALDGDRGPNTGGMGAYAPAGAVDTALRDQIQTQVLEPAVAGMAAEGTPFVGILYAGLMRTDRGIQVLEFNCRFGDPETQVVLPLLAGDIVAIFQACIDGELARATIEWHSGACVTVVVASGGYPAAYRSGIPIEGIATADALDDVTVFHAGTALHDGRVVTAGGRVVAVTGRGADLAAATATAYRGAARIDFEGAYYRSDIAAGAAVEHA